MAREVGSSDQLYSSALVTVNLVDRNDNLPVFERDKYEVDVHENEQNGKVVLKVGLEKRRYEYDRVKYLVESIHTFRRRILPNFLGES